MKLYTSLGPSPVTIQLFALERGGLQFEAIEVDILNLENRQKWYREEVNSRSEVPVLLLESGQSICELPAICEYLDEVAEGGRSLVGGNPEERANTRMWTRRVFLEICLPILNYFRSSDMSEDFYRGYRIPNPAAAGVYKLVANQHLNRFEEDLEGKQYICGDSISLADIILFSHMDVMLNSCRWLNPPGRKKCLCLDGKNG